MIQNNITIIAAIIVFFHYVKRDLSCLDEATTLLSIYTNRYLLTANVEQHLQGTYLYYVLNDENGSEVER